MKAYRCPPERPRRIKVWVSKCFGVVELRGAPWRFAWEYPKLDKRECRIQRLGFPPEMEMALETFLAKLYKQGYYLRSLELHSNLAADKLDKLLKKGEEQGLL